MKRSQGHFPKVLFALSLVAASLAVLAAPLPAQAEVIMALTGDGVNGFEEWGGECDGYEFLTGGSDLIVSWLGFYDAPNGEGTVGDGLLASHQVSIWKVSDGSVVATTLIEPSNSLIGNFRGHDIGPVTLLENTSYIIGANFGGGDRQREGDDLTGWGINGITLVGGRYGGTGGEMPTGGWYYMIGPNFGYTLPVAPTPLTWTGSDAVSPTQWSTSAGVLNWTDGSTAFAYRDGNDVMFDNSVGAGSKTVSISAGDVAPASVTFDNAVTGAAVYTLTGPNGITGATALTKKGDGTLVVENVNSYTGATKVSGGTLKLGNVDAIPHGAGKGNVQVGGTLDLNGLSPTINGLSGGGTVTTGVAGAVELTVGDADADGTFTGSISDGAGTVALKKIGGGLLLLEKANTYSGGTTVSSGTLRYNSTDAFGTGTVTLAGGTTFAAKGGGTAEGRYLFPNEDIANDFVLSGGPGNGGLVNLPVGHGEAKDIWFKGVVSGPGGFLVTGTHRVVTLSNNNTFEGGVTLDCTTNADYACSVQIASYGALGTGTYTAKESVHAGATGGLRVAEPLDGTSADPHGITNPKGIENPIEIAAGKYFNVCGEGSGNNPLFSGTISGGGTLRKHRNDSAVTLSGTIAHTGGTIVHSGTLTINGTLDHSNVLIDTDVWKQWVYDPDQGWIQIDVSYPPKLNGSGTLTFNIEDTTCDLIRVMNGGTLDITNLHIDVAAANLTELSYVLVDWAIEAGEGEPAILPGNLIGAKFAGESVPHGWKIDYDLVEKQILLVPGVLGDTNLDGVVDAADYIAVKQNLGLTGGASLAQGNLDGDGDVDWDDLQIVMTNFGAGSGAAPGTAPEPATLGLLAIGALAMLRRNRRSLGLS
jgi:autotransporter-associated beta strand protein